MLHTKFRGNQPTGSGEEGFRRVSTIYGRVSHLGHVTKIMSAVSEKIHFNLFVCTRPWTKVKK